MVAGIGGKGKVGSTRRGERSTGVRQGPGELQSAIGPDLVAGATASGWRWSQVRGS